MVTVGDEEWEIAIQRELTIGNRGVNLQFYFYPLSSSMDN